MRPPTDGIVYFGRSCEKGSEYHAAVVDLPRSPRSRRRSRHRGLGGAAPPTVRRCESGPRPGGTPKGPWTNSTPPATGSPSSGSGVPGWRSRGAELGAINRIEPTCPTSKDRHHPPQGRSAGRPMDTTEHAAEGHVRSETRSRCVTESTVSPNRSTRSRFGRMIRLGCPLPTGVDSVTVAMAAAPH